MTKRQKEALQVAIAFIDENGFSPTFRELKELLGLKSQSSVHTLFIRLKEQGYVTWEYDRPRTLKILVKGVAS
ncbi:transcriptional regulator [Geomicrobium sediminis]|uniref:Repressor LexA n=1 Tax=Geomicrobium sediminis TaxID=1347788 RepID=A0ABS2P8Q7_9BACL|nr:transcriptional regulator [Geomicrobium sediminis]MBM7631736.1 repressor LexA [Geomicrobium sediminis]